MNNFDLSALKVQRGLSELDIKIPIIDRTKCIIKIANKTNVNEKTKRKAMDIMYHLNRLEVPAGKNPMGIASNSSVHSVSKYW